MEVGERSIDGASLSIGLPSGLPAHMHEGVRELTHLRVDEQLRRTGIATKLLAAVCEEADSAKKVLFLIARSYGEMPTDRLIDWYKRFGFIALPKKDESDDAQPMARQPRIEQPVLQTVIANPSLPPKLEIAQRRIGELRKLGVALPVAMRMALDEASGRVH